MKRSVLSFLLLVVSSAILFAQRTELMLKSGDKGLYIEHKIIPKENFYSIGRLFNVPAKEIASFNTLDMSKGLSIGQVIRIPLTEENFSQNVNEGMPVYTVATEKESLSHLSSKNKNVSIENLRRWNDLSNDNVKSGTKLIAGFLISGELANAKSIVIAKGEKPVDVVEKNKKNEEIKKTEPVTTMSPVKEESKETIKEEPKKEEAVKEATTMKTTTLPGSGYFKDNFEQQVKVYPLSKETTVTSSIFKTTSGWRDAKFYALLDGVEPGTVIKVTNPSNNKSIYAKVLGAMKGIRQNKGLDLRISDAATSALDISDTDKFIVKVNY